MLCRWVDACRLCQHQRVDSTVQCGHSATRWALWCSGGWLTETETNAKGTSLDLLDRSIVHPLGWTHTCHCVLQAGCCPKLSAWPEMCPTVWWLLMPLLFFLWMRVGGRRACVACRLLRHECCRIKIGSMRVWQSSLNGRSPQSRQAWPES